MKKILLIIVSILFVLDSILTEIGIRFYNAIELNPFYNFEIFLIIKILIIGVLIYKREYFSNRIMFIIIFILVLPVINNSVWLMI